MLANEYFRRWPGFRQSAATECDKMESAINEIWGMKA
jgi:hypothetical protein